MNENVSTFDWSDEQHNSVIIHIDIDCFYAQVEEIRDPSLRNKPVGITQKYLLVTCNYVARSYGLKKMIPVAEAQRLCPDLVLVNGEDLTPYRQMSNKINGIMHRYTPLVEKLGFDENYLDVTSIVDEKITESYNENPIQDNRLVDCNVFPEYETLSSCCCGCEKRLIIGAKIASEIRQKLYNELGITSCAGIAHNKLLAKIIGSKNRPNKQTVLIPSCTNDVMIGLGTIRSIPGIGLKAEQTLNEAGVRTIKELQDIDFGILEKHFGYATATKYKNWSRGIDKSNIIPTGKPKTIGLEDACRTISFRADVEDKLRHLLMRLINKVADDGRIPLVMKITVRKFDADKKTSHRETKQANIMPTLFKQLSNGKIELVENGQDKLLKIVMRLFERVVNLKAPFKITLLGLAFSKFQHRNKTNRSIANFLIRTTDMEVQSITSLSSDGLQSIKNYQLRGSPTQMDFDTTSEASHASYSSDNISESEISEPSPKKNKFSLPLAKRRCLSTNTSMDTASPSKLRVADLRLNSIDMDVSMQQQQTIANHDTSATSTITNSIVTCFTPTPNIVYENINSGITEQRKIDYETQAKNFPPIVDPEVFKELPVDVQEELLQQWQTPNETATNIIATTTTSTVTESHSNAILKSRTGNKKANTLHRYFITNN